MRGFIFQKDKQIDLSSNMSDEFFSLIETIRYLVIIVISVFINLLEKPLAEVT